MVVLWFVTKDISVYDVMKHYIKFSEKYFQNYFLHEKFMGSFKSIFNLLLIQLFQFSMSLLREDTSNGAFKFVDAVNRSVFSAAFFKNAYKEGVSNPVYIQEAMNVKEFVPCYDISDMTSLPVGAKFLWMSKSMHPIYSKNVRTMPNGECVLHPINSKFNLIRVHSTMMGLERI